MELDEAPVAIRYRPRLAGRIARMVSPGLRRVLPPAAYRQMYYFMYRRYKRLLRLEALLHVGAARIVGNETLLRRAVLTHRLLPYTMGGRLALENAFDVVRQADLDEIPGALVECGVAEGGTAAMMALANRSFGAARRELWLFDSFEGLPEPTKEDYQGQKTGEFIQPLAKGTCVGTVEQVSTLMFDALGLDRSEVHLVKGWFQQTVPAHRPKIESIAVLRLDGDWYESTKIPLENFYGKISPGGMVIIDDYATCFGARRATDEFRMTQGIEASLRPDGRGGAWFRKPRL